VRTYFSWVWHCWDFFVARLDGHDLDVGVVFLGLGVDDGVDPFGGHVYATWASTTPDRVQHFHPCATTSNH
jgi:hypothetical protein